MRILILLTLFLLSPITSLIAQAPPAEDARLYDIAEAPSAERLKQDITRLANFGTRHTLSDTTSDSRGIGAARRWIFAEFQRISKDCGGCLEVFYQRNLVPEGESRRIPTATWVVNVIAIHPTAWS